MNQSDPIAAPDTAPAAAEAAPATAPDSAPVAAEAAPATAPDTAPAVAETAPAAAPDTAPTAAETAPAAATPATAPAAAAPKPAKTARIVVITSGKGGVGKTTTAASFSAGLALRGYKTAVIDFDVGLRNLDLIMGCERRVVYDLINVIHEEASLHQALIRDKNCDNLHVLPASQTRDKDALTQRGVENVLNGLQDLGFDYIICDSPAGIETGALLAMHYADEALVVTNPEVSSVRDSDRILGILASKTKRAIDGAEPIKEHLLITRYNPKRVVGGEMLSLEDIQEILRIRLIGVIPESESVLQASNQGLPAVHLNGTDVAGAYKDVVSRFLGEDIPLRFTDYQKPGFFKRLFGNR